MKTPINTINHFELTNRLTGIVQQAYFRRSRQLPANIADIVDTLKGDLLKAFPDVPIETVDDAIVTSTLHDIDTTISPAFFFNAVKKVWFTPKTNRHGWDEEEYRRPDTELDTISLLDTCASMLAKMDAKEALGQHTQRRVEFKGVVVDLPAFNPRREYGYLVMRKQLAPDAASHFFSKAIQAVNDDRMATHHYRLEKDEAIKDPDVLAKCQRLAVLDWLRACNTRNTTPSAILTPLAEELSYFDFRRTK